MPGWKNLGPKILFYRYFDKQGTKFIIKSFLLMFIIIFFLSSGKELLVLGLSVGLSVSSYVSQYVKKMSKNENI